MDRECCICGKLLPESKMQKVFTGRTQWWCWECYKSAHGQAAGFEMRNRHKREKEWNK